VPRLPALRTLAVLSLAFVPLGAGACGTSSSGSPRGPYARFDLTSNPVPAFLDVPFPSDVYLQNGTVTDIAGIDAIATQSSKFISHELAKMDGFSRTALALFYVDDPAQPVGIDGKTGSALVDASTLPTDETACAADASSVSLIDLDATDPAQARVPCRALWHVDKNSGTSRPVLAVGPARGVVLAEAHHYAAAITSRVKTEGGQAIAPSADFARVQRGDASVPAPYVSAYPKVTAALGVALAGDHAQVVAVAPFTTNAMTKDLYALRDGLEGAPAPALAWDAASMAPMGVARFAGTSMGTLPAGFTAGLDDWLGVVDPKNKLPDGSDDPDSTLPVRAHDAIAAVGTAVFESTNWLQHYYDSADYTVLDHATFAYGSDGKPMPAADHPTAKIWVTLAVPTAAMPAGGYPAVIFQHGLGGTRNDLFAVANTFCKAGWIAVAIDSITFGARAPEPGFQKDAKSQFYGSPGATYQGPDGLADPDPQLGGYNGSTDLFGTLLDLGALRDQFRQAEIDTAQLVGVLRSNPDLSPLTTTAGAPKIDPARIAYVGNSLGAIQGTVAAALEPHVPMWVLNVDGGGVILELAVHAPIVSNLLQLAAVANFGVEGATFDEGHPLVTLMQTVVEPADPLAFAGDLVLHPQPLKGQATQPRNILQFEVVYDEWVPNEADEALARAGGWGLAQPNVGSNAHILDYKHIDQNTGQTPLPNVVAAADGTIHDTPAQGVTAVVVQQSPATHGDNLTASRGGRQFCIPYADFSSDTPFIQLAAPDAGGGGDTYFDVPDPYRETQATIVRFFGDGFAGKVPPVIAGKAPVRDLDADGALDDVDRDACNPNIQ
jgi:hypothetical protein